MLTLLTKSSKWRLSNKRGWVAHACLEQTGMSGIRLIHSDEKDWLFFGKGWSYLKKHSTCDRLIYDHVVISTDTFMISPCCDLYDPQTKIVGKSEQAKCVHFQSIFNVTWPIQNSALQSASNITRHSIVSISNKLVSFSNNLRLGSMDVGRYDDVTH